MLYGDRDLALSTCYYSENAKDEFFRGMETPYVAGDYDAISELAIERRCVLMFYQDGPESGLYYLYSLDDEPNATLQSFL